MSKHTPGPWTPVVNEWDEALLEPGEWYWYIIAPDEGVIASRLAEPDAHLIAAAPDLLAVLKEFASGRNAINRLSLQEAVDLTERARAAIAKAEGDL